MDTTNIKRKVQEYKRLKEEIGFLTTRQNEAKKSILEDVTAYGEEDGRGHIILEFDDIKITNQKRVSKALDMETAETILAEKNLTERCVQMVPLLDEDAIMAAFYEGQLTEEDIDSMFPAKVSYALII